MATDSFTSSAASVAAHTATLTRLAPGASKLTLIGGWEVSCNSAGVYISKASSFGGTQVAPTWPVSRENARQLALALLDVVT